MYFFNTTDCKVRDMGKRMNTKETFRMFILNIMPSELKKFIDDRAVDMIMFKVARRGAHELVNVKECNDVECALRKILAALKELGMIRDYEVEDCHGVVRGMSGSRTEIAFVVGAIVGAIEQISKVSVISPLGKYVVSDADLLLEVSINSGEVTLRCKTL